MKKLLIVLAIVAVALSGCSTTATATVTKTVTASAQSSSSPSASKATASTNGIGATHTSGGITATLLSAGEQPTISYDTCGDGCSNGTYAPKSPSAGQKWWVATFNITNNTKDPIDVTCSAPVTVKAVNSKGQRYTPIDSIYQVQNNPKCDFELQPGNSEKALFPFEIPSSADVVAVGFYDSSDPSDSGMYKNPGIFTLDTHHKVTCIGL